MPWITPAPLPNPSAPTDVGPVRFADRRLSCSRCSAVTFAIDRRTSKPVCARCLKADRSIATTSEAV